jgi:hypothetical protein
MCKRINSTYIDSTENPLSSTQPWLLYFSLIHAEIQLGEKKIDVNPGATSFDDSSLNDSYSQRRITKEIYDEIAKDNHGNAIDHCGERRACCRINHFSTGFNRNCDRCERELYGAECRYWGE